LEDVFVVGGGGVVGENVDGEDILHD
jgi:hypothetical protein